MKVLIVNGLVAMSLVFSLSSGLFGQEKALEKSDRPHATGIESGSSSKGSPESAHTPGNSPNGGSGTNAAEKTAHPPTTAAHDAPILKALLDDKTTSGPVLDAYQKWMVKYYERQIEILDERKAVIRGTNIISNIVCVIVHLALAVCFWIAITEYQHAMKLRSKEPSNTELSVSLNQISVKTARHGIVLFVLAIVLYYLYLTIVYPITVVG